MRQSIRDRRSEKDIQPRVMDYVCEENGTELLELKDGKVLKTILLEDFEEQIAEARSMAYAHAMKYAYDCK